MPVSKHALAVLDRIEAIEMRSLEWGFTDGSLSEDEAFDLGDQVCEAAEVSGTDGKRENTPTFSPVMMRL